MENTKLQMTMDEFKQGNYFVNWAREQQNGRTTKIPYNAVGNNRASSDNPSTWSDYNAAKKNVDAGHRDGIGVMFSEFSGQYSGYVLAGIDIDAHNVDQNPLANEILNKFKDTYVERSPSGKGYHILFLVEKSSLVSENELDKPLDASLEEFKKHFYMKNSQSDVECYVAGLTNRYFTFSENAVKVTRAENGEMVKQELPKDAPRAALIDMTAEFKEFLLDYMVKPFYEKSKETAKANTAESKAAVDKKREAMDMSDNELLEVAFNSQYGSDIKALYYGDMSRYNNDHSSADLGLCKQLAFWTGGDAARIDTLFRQSALYREKWEREDYRNATISKAIDYCGGKFFTPDYAKARPAYDKEAAQLEKRKEFLNSMVDKYLSDIKSKGDLLDRKEEEKTIDAYVFKYGGDEKRDAEILQIIANSELDGADKLLQEVAKMNGTLTEKGFESAMSIGRNVYNAMKPYMKGDGIEALSKFSISDEQMEGVKLYISFTEKARDIIAKRMVAEIALDKASALLEKIEPQLKQPKEPTLE